MMNRRIRTVDFIVMSNFGFLAACSRLRSNCNFAVFVQCYSAFIFSESTAPDLQLECILKGAYASSDGRGCSAILTTQAASKIDASASFSLLRTSTAFLQ